MQLNLDTSIIALCSAYLAIRGGQELFRFSKKVYLENYFPLKQASQYKNNQEVYLYHLFHFAQKLLNEHKSKKAAKYLRMILDKNPEFQLANYLYGVICFENKQFAEANDYLTREARLTPEHPLVYFFLSKCQCKLNQYAEALATLEKSVALNPYYYPSYLLAMEIFHNLKTDPKTEWAFFHQSEKAQSLVKPIWMHMSELEKSFLDAETITQRDELYAKLDEAWLTSTQLKERTIGALNEKQVFQAENLLLEGLRLNPHDNQLYQIYDQLLVLQKKFPEALSFYEQHMKRINPTPLEAILRLTDYLVFNRQYERAQAIMLDIFQKYPYAKFLHYPLSILCNWLNQPEEAIYHLEQGIYYDSSVKKLAQQNPDLQNLQQWEKFRNLLQ